MRPIIFIAFMLIVVSPGFSQVNWFPTNAKWHYEVVTMVGPGLSTLEVLNEDTMINNNVYRKIVSTTVVNINLAILDTFKSVLYAFEENGVVYGYDNYFGGSLLYDFNAEVGDTLDIHFGGNSPSPFVVVSNGEVEINGSFLKYQDIRYPYMFFPGQFDEFRVIEGLGSIGSHLFHQYKVIDPSDHPDYSFRCYEDDDIGLVNLSLDQVDCDYLYGLTSTFFSKNEPVLIFPNPTFDFVTVLYDRQPIDYFVVTDILGSIRIREYPATQSTYRINLNKLECGLYFIMAIDKTGRILFTEKITKNGS